MIKLRKLHRMAKDCPVCGGPYYPGEKCGICGFEPFNTRNTKPALEPWQRMERDKDGRFERQVAP